MAKKKKGGYKNIDPHGGVKFGQGQDPTRGGRRPSIRTQIKDLLQAEGDLTIPANQIKKINQDGSVVMKVPTEMQIAMKLQSWAMSRRGSDSLKAIQMIMEQVDGKPDQKIDVTSNDLKTVVKFTRKKK